MPCPSSTNQSIVRQTRRNRRNRCRLSRDLRSVRPHLPGRRRGLHGRFYAPARFGRRTIRYPQHRQVSLSNAECYLCTPIRRKRLQLSSPACDAAEEVELKPEFRVLELQQSIYEDHKWIYSRRRLTLEFVIHGCHKDLLGLQSQSPIDLQI